MVCRSKSAALDLDIHVQSLIGSEKSQLPVVNTTVFKNQLQALPTLLSLLAAVVWLNCAFYNVTTAFAVLFCL